MFLRLLAELDGSDGLAEGHSDVLEIGGGLRHDLYEDAGPDIDHTGLVVLLIEFCDLIDGLFSFVVPVALESWQFVFNSWVFPLLGDTYLLQLGFAVLEGEVQRGFIELGEIEVLSVHAYPINYTDSSLLDNWSEFHHWQGIGSAGAGTILWMYLINVG